MLRTIAFSPIFEASELTVAKRKSDMPMRAEDPTMAYVDVSVSSSQRLRLSQDKSLAKRGGLAIPFTVPIWQGTSRYVPIYDQFVGSRTSRHLA